MKTTALYLKLVAFGFAFHLAAPTFAQSSFQGLDSSETKQKKKSSRSKKKRSKKVPAQTKPAAPSSKAAATTAVSTPVPSVTKVSEPVKPEIPMPPPPAPKPAPTLTFEAVDVSGKSAERQRLEVAAQQFRQEQYELAALTGYQLMRDQKMVGLQLDAQYVLAKSLYRLGMYHSSLGEFSNMLAKGPQTKFFKNGLEWLFFISHKTTNESVILEEIAKYANFEFPQRFRGEFRYLLARYHFVRGKALDQIDQRAEASKSFDQVKALILTVPKGDPFYARAKYLEGLAYFRDNNFSTAVESMKEVIRTTRPAAAKEPTQARLDQETRELAFMQLARTHYGVKQNRNAIYYYNKVERGGKQWLEALFESSWANYRISQYEQALGNLVTLSSPFFREEYFPEALILKAVIYYENCRYRESRSTLEDFERIYMPVHDQLDLMTRKELEAAEYFKLLEDIEKKNLAQLPKSSTDIILGRILRLALTDRDLKNTNDSILELEAEIDSISKRSDSFRYSEMAKNLLAGLKVQRELLVKKAGTMAKGKLESELAELKKLLTNGLRIKFETTGKEKEFLEEQLRAGGKQEIVKNYRYSVAVSDDQLYWPYEGEYWRDELGTYQYTLTKGCIEHEAVNRATGGDAL